MRISPTLIGLLLLTLLTPPLASDEKQTAPDIPQAKNLWAYTPPKKAALPTLKMIGWVRNPIDAFILAKLEAAGLAPSPEADKLTLLRRVTFDLTGLPPTIAEQDAFLGDASAAAYERVVDRLLASPRHGERWAQHWLDVVRYAETDGFKADDHRPNAYRYRDWVIRALNTDLPYDRFIRHQLAGDELEPDNADALIATGFNRLWPDEYNAANLEQRRQEILDDLTEVTSLAFLGLTLGCARCHDHKFDPLLQTDYYRMQAYFAATLPRDDLSLASPDEVRRHREKVEEWGKVTAPVRSEMDSLLGDKPQEMRQQALTKFRDEIQQAVQTAEVKRTPYQQQIAAMAQQQINRAEKEAPTKMAADKKKRYQELEQQLAKSAPKPPALPGVMGIADVGATAPPVHLLAGGDWRKPKQELQPGFPLVLSDASGGRKPSEEAADGSTGSLRGLTPSARQGATTGRRTALAKWLTRKDHPLTSRVMVNRLWQHHFGKGIVGTPNDFGLQGEAPTHPALLDWLAVEFVAHGWSLKEMHRLMVTSATYRQSSIVEPGTGNGEQPALVPRSEFRVLSSDTENNLLWHARRRRLDGESLRDAMLSASGELNLRMSGPSAKPKLPDKISSYAWKPDAKPEEQNRRSVYILAKRNMRYPLFDAFDLPDMHNSCACRSQTTTAPQALLLLNGDLALESAAGWAKALRAAHSEDHRSLVSAAYRTAWGRQPLAEEIDLALRFIERQTETLKSGDAAVADFCHALLNSNEFAWVD